MDVQEVNRRSGGVEPREIMKANARRHDREVHALRDAGQSISETMSILGLSRGAVVRALARSLDGLEAYQQTVERPLVETPASEPVAASDELGSLERAIRYLVVSQGIETADELAEVLGEPTYDVVLAMGRLGMPVGDGMAIAA